MTGLPMLDPLLHQPVRTQLVAFLAARGEASFSEIKKALEITDGNLGAHLNKLTEAGLIASRQGPGPGRSVLYLTPLGQARLNDYVMQLSSLMQMGNAAASEDEIPIFSFPQPKPQE